MSYSFNPNAKSGKRVQSVEVGDGKIDLEKKYTVACRARISFGHGKSQLSFRPIDIHYSPTADGFDSLKIQPHDGPAEEVIADEYGILISMILRQYFMSLKVISGMANFAFGSGMAETWGAIQARMHQIHALRDNPNGHPADHDPAAKGNVDTYTTDDEDAPTPGTQESVEHGRRLAIMRKTLRRWRKFAGCEGHPGLVTNQEEVWDADWTKGICPQLEGRIKMTEELAR